jgi:hypothetical protein
MAASSPAARRARSISAECWCRAGSLSRSRNIHMAPTPPTSLLRVVRAAASGPAASQSHRSIAPACMPAEAAWRSAPTVERDSCSDQAGAFHKPRLKSITQAKRPKDGRRRPMPQRASHSSLVGFSSRDQVVERCARMRICALSDRVFEPVSAAIDRRPERIELRRDAAAGKEIAEAVVATPRSRNHGRRNPGAPPAAHAARACRRAAETHWSYR